MTARFATTLALLLFVAVPALATDLTPPAERPPAANFRLDDLDGHEVQLTDFEGQVVVISFWATWCQPCLQELPHLSNYYDAHNDEGLVVLAITTDGTDTLPDVRNIVRRQRWQMPVLLDHDGAVLHSVNTRGTNPFTIFVDRQGRVAGQHEGFNSGDEVAHLERIQALLAEGTETE